MQENDADLEVESLQLQSLKDLVRQHAADPESELRGRSESLPVPVFRPSRKKNTEQRSQPVRSSAARAGKASKQQDRLADTFYADAPDSTKNSALPQKDRTANVAVSQNNQAKAIGTLDKHSHQLPKPPAFRPLLPDGTPDSLQISSDDSEKEVYVKLARARSPSEDETSEYTTSGSDMRSTSYSPDKMTTSGDETEPERFTVKERKIRKVERVQRREAQRKELQQRKEQRRVEKEMHRQMRESAKEQARQIRMQKEAEDNRLKEVLPKEEVKASRPGRQDHLDQIVSLHFSVQLSSSKVISALSCSSSIIFPQAVLD